MFKENRVLAGLIKNQKKHQCYTDELAQLILDLRSEVKQEGYGDVSLKGLPVYDKVKAFSPKERKNVFLFVIHCAVFPMKQMIRQKSGEERCRIEGSDNKELRIVEGIMNGLVRLRLDFTQDEIIDLFNFYKRCDDDPGGFLFNFSLWPIGYSMVHLEKYIKQNGLSSELESFLTEMHEWEAFTQKKYYYGSDIQSSKLKISKILREYSQLGVSFKFNEEDVIGEYFNQKINDTETGLQKMICDLCHHSTSAKAGKPSKKWLEQSKSIVSAVDTKKFKEFILDVFNFLIKSKEIESHTTYEYSGETYTYPLYCFLHESNSTVLKGLVWSLSQFHDQTTLDLLSRLAERCFKKIPGVGPASGAIGNACIYTLFSSKGKMGLSHLSRLKLRIKQNNTRKLIQKYIDEAADQLGVTPSALEEMAVPNFALENGKRVVDFDDYKLELCIIAVGKTQLQWYKPDGKTQKSVPAFVKQSAKHTEKLKKLRADAKQIQKYSSAQRDRIDRLYKDDREWNLDDFLTYYHDHGLVNFISRRLIWSFEIGDDVKSAIWYEGDWVDSSGNNVEVKSAKSVRLWHPLSEIEESVLAWRSFLEDKLIVQPMKQAYREVYILTEAELNTRVYSNRMAAHILKQHQFNALGGTRGWKYTLQGAYDGGDTDEFASIKLTAHDMTAEFWINLINDVDAINDSGIYDYIATDQVRFLDKDGNVLPLIEVPRLVFSEIMRDVDLFVGVASVGNDPEWQDRGGLTEYRDYWTNYSFGDLTELAKTRKSVLEKLLPRLKIKNVVSIDGKFLRVKGKVREYKIHIGSSNILMEPNDQYLCIVPDRSSSRKTDNLFLPFEGDRGLSLVISKAFLLVADDKITDQTILSQIKR